MTPDITVVVPTFGRPTRLDACLRALAQQDLDPSRFEVVVVDDGSPEPLDDIVARHRDRLRLALYRQANAGPATARNAGAARAAARFLAFTDDDCTPSPDWVASLLAALEAAPSAMVGGRTVNALVDNPYAEASQALLSYLYERSGLLAHELDELAFFASNNLALASDQFRGLGGFDTAFPAAAAEDRDLSDRWREAGHPLRYEPKAVVHHAHAMDLAGFWRQHLAYGRGAQRYQRSRVERGRSPLAIEGIGFYLGMLRYPFRGRPARWAVSVAVLIALSQLATAAGFVAERRRPSACERPI